MVKVLIADSYLNQGGITTLTKQWIKYINHEKFDVELLTYDMNKNHNYITEDDCVIHRIDFGNINIFKYIRELYILLKNGHYDVIHSNNLLNSGYIMFIAYLCNVPVRICHSHFSENYKKSFIFKIYEYVMRKLITKCSNVKIACSDKAGEFLYGDDSFIILKNAIDANRFTFNIDKRKQVRTKYDISDDDILVGTVAMLCEPKNQVFIIELANYIINTKKIRNIKFMLCGDGPLREYISDKISEYNLDSFVTITGWDSDTPKYFSAYDIYIMPSKTEGLPLAGLEAQASGLPCLFSTSVSMQTKVTDKCVFLDTDAKQYDIWLDAIYSFSKKDKRDNSLIDTEYEIQSQVRILESLYCGNINNK